MRRIIAILLLFVFTISLTSCFDAEEVDDLLFVSAMGIDEGKSDKWRLTLQFPAMKSGGGGEESGGSSHDSFEYICVDAPSFFTGINMLNAALPKKLNFSQMQLIVFSEELVKKGDTGQFIAPLGRFRQTRKSANVLVIKGNALDFIKELKPSLSPSLSKEYQLFKQIADFTGFFAHVTFEDFYTGLKSTSHQAMAPLAAVNDFKNFKEKGPPWGTKFKTGGDYEAGELPRTGSNKVEIFGTAVFSGDRMVESLSGEETRFLLMVRNEYRGGLFTIPDPRKPEVIIPLDVKAGKRPEIRLTMRKSKPLIEVRLHLDGSLLAVQSMIDYEQHKLKASLEREFAKTVREGTEEVIRKCQRANADVFKFGAYAARNFLTIDEFEKYNWNQHFKDAEIVVDVDFIIRRTGTQIRSSPLRGDE